MRYLRLILFILSLAIVSGGYAKENVGAPPVKKNKRVTESLAEGCEPTNTSVDLDVNNVRARIMNAGDMWWDLVGAAKYEVPKVTEAGQPRKHSLFAGALWIGGWDQGDNLRAAAMTYRQSQGYDFFPGPLDTATASISKEECIRWDKIWKVSQEEIDSFRKNPRAGMTEDIRTWPAHGDVTKGQSRYLAPFIDVDTNGMYEPLKGDYPDILGDQALWFVYNDKGNIHTETSAPAIGLEVQSLAFAYATNDEINNMTFYKQKIINRSKDQLDSVFFGQWVDADLGFAFDDYVASDTTRDLGICYNGDDFDDGVNGYGSNPPSVGVDFFQGPIDENGDEIGMEYFVYYDNDFSIYGNPERALHYYNYLTGSWKNGDCITADGKNGRGAGECTNYMFPGDPKDPNDWSEVTAGNQPFDRRFLQSAGPFVLMPGAVNYITVGAVWAKATTGGNTGSLDLLRLADDKAQQLYNNNFKLIDGPDAPEVEVQELDRKIVIAFLNTQTEKVENYKDEVVSIDNEDTIKYLFQGYQLYQVKDPTVTAEDIGNPDKIRLIAQVDIEDEVSKLVNLTFDEEVGMKNGKVMVEGDNSGIKHSFLIEKDAFASGEDRLVNYQPYYFLVVSYASTDPNDPVSVRADDQYLQGRKNVKVYTAYPHKNMIEKGGAVVKAAYGDRPVMKRIEGIGNGGLILNLTPQTEQKILTDFFDPHPEYQLNGGPANIFVYDPMDVPDVNFKLKIQDSSISQDPGSYVALDNHATWQIENENTLILSDTTLAGDNEQIIENWGLSAKIEAVLEPTLDTVTQEMGFLDATFEFEDDQITWLFGVPDIDAPSNFVRDEIPYAYNWIRSGKSNSGALDVVADDAYVSVGLSGTHWIDPNEVYEEILGGMVAPYGLVARSGSVSKGRTTYYTYGPAYPQSSYSHGSLDNLNSIDLVFTNNMDNWSRSLVIEMSEDFALAEGGATKFSPRRHNSWLTKEVKDGKPVYSPNDQSRSWFPGYAINLETGERLNIIFGEDSWFQQENGNDMLWNPSGQMVNPGAGTFDYDRYVFGGKHYTYVMNSKGMFKSHKTDPKIQGGRRYSLDASAQYRDIMNGTRLSDKVVMWSSAMWVMIPIHNEEFKYLPLSQGMIPSDARIRLRVAKSYKTFQTEGTPENNWMPYYEVSTNKLSVEVSPKMAKEALQQVGIVPNPYYAYSKYETNQLDNRVRFINLPPKARISIYTLSGALVREFYKDELPGNHTPFLDWDLKNSAGIPIGSGMYLIHINGFEHGEKTIKWFASMRPLDLDTF